MAKPKFQARHYEAIAAAIARTRQASAIGRKKRSPEETLHLLVCDLTGTFRNDNPNFDADRFKGACGV